MVHIMDCITYVSEDARSVDSRFSSMQSLKRSKGSLRPGTMPNELCMQIECADRVSIETQCGMAITRWPSIRTSNLEANAYSMKIIHISEKRNRLHSVHRRASQQGRPSPGVDGQNNYLFMNNFG